MINLLLLFSFFFISSAQTLPPLTAPLKKDAATSLHTILLNSSEPYLVDIAAPFSWRRCSPRHFPTVDCFTTECFQATYLPSPCPPPPTSSSTPCKCMVTPSNPITQSCASDHLIFTNLTLTSTAQIFSNITLSCAPNSLLRSLPKGALGLASLSLAPLSLQNQFSDRFPQITRKFALCLSSKSSRNGKILFGDAPYGRNAPNLISYTPLLTNPKSAAYAVGIKALSVGTRSIMMSPFEGIGLSTVVPYTTLVSDVYEQFVGFFEEAMRGVPKMEGVKPFTSCYRASAINGSRVPRIDLEFEGGKNWTIYGANSMKFVGRDTACLAFVDGGAAMSLKIVVGAFQMEDNLLVFDVENLRFGFSSSLLSKGMSCAKF